VLFFTRDAQLGADEVDVGVDVAVRFHGLSTCLGPDSLRPVTFLACPSSRCRGLLPQIIIVNATQVQ